MARTRVVLQKAQGTTKPLPEPVEGKFRMLKTSNYFPSTGSGNNQAVFLVTMRQRRHFIWTHQRPPFFRF